MSAHRLRPGQAMQEGGLRGRGTLSPRDCTHRQRLEADGARGGERRESSSRDTGCQGNSSAADPDLGKTSHAEDAIPGVGPLPRAWRSATERLPTAKARLCLLTQRGCACSRSGLVPHKKLRVPLQQSHRSVPSRFLPCPAFRLLAFPLRGERRSPCLLYLSWVYGRRLR